jgi:hypothetical protein
MASSTDDRFSLNENDIPGAKLNKNLENITKKEAIRWLKCRGCNKLSQLTLQQLKNK